MRPMIEEKSSYHRYALSILFHANKLMNVYSKILKNIYQPDNIPLFDTLLTLVTPHSEQIAKNFYREMLSNPHAAHFLNHDEVKKRLTASMTNWIISVFIYRDSEQTITDYRNYQLSVGYIHSKIGLPVSLVNYGVYVIKQDISLLLVRSHLDRDTLGAALILANQLLNCTSQIINESYEGNLVINEKDSQAFKIQFSTHHLAFDCERLRVSLSDWMRDLLLNAQQDLFNVGLATIRQSNFGLWVSHKAKLFFADRPELSSLVCLLNDMDDILQDLAKYQNNKQQKQALLIKLNTLVSQTSWVLGELAKEIIDQDSGRDSLTHLFNRRYLDTVMHHETASSLKTGVCFGVIILDIDYFKSINDTYGHDNGDKVLEQLADILTHEVRAGDFVFRLGGEEFLIVLGDVNERIICSVAEKIRLTISNSIFKLANNKNLTITVSIGVAIHDGHPDFQRTIKLADDALYQAKENGRNQVMSAKQLPPI
jgi:diguanylate cyclase